MSIPVIERTRFAVGKYEVIAKPIPYSAHMLLYSVFLKGTRIGAMASFPTESDCRFLEKPPVVPPLKIYQLTNRPGRPKKGSKPPAQAAERSMPPSRSVIPSDVSLDGMPRIEDR
ncbi:MAG: hypothetical protein O3A06_03570 [Proteobacteria bacterium]|nr:hypothetical protein [Pseudomonadota bacterium]MDA0982116.1 hypothetical protein [Pseudomonadota bacterium]